ncbi:DUF5677 domain-containing protein [Vibrio alginolyticus]|uniref:DUF5677 domain-containing protein n=1 Tax=Vibrio alginolyticus TaxID=663 RepID=UPI001C3E043E|nr:DUF5677 domain-containing protein [Vibrio alginolyticus]
MPIYLFDYPLTGRYKSEIFMRTIQELFNKILEDLVADNPAKARELDIKKLVADLTPEFVEMIGKSLHSSMPEMLSHRRSDFSSFADMNVEKWQSAFDLLETHIVICTEAGATLNSKYRPEAAEQGDLIFDLLVRHHARACHIANEILCLLKNGFPDAAHSRWRALHEVNATALFIFNHGQECAERFYFHDVVDAYDAMKEHRKYEDRLQAKGPTDIEMNELKKVYDDLIIKYGRNYAGHYGWAAYLFPGHSRVGFGAIEKDVGLEHMRPYYKWASQNIHAGSKGLRNRLALADCSEDILVVGQSNSGMTDPAHATAISLLGVTSTLLTYKPSMDTIVMLQIAAKYSDKIGREFLRLSRNTDL